MNLYFYVYDLGSIKKRIETKYTKFKPIKMKKPLK